MDFPKDDLVAQERAALVVWLLGVDGERLTTVEIAQKTGLELRGAYRMMSKLARVVDIRIGEGGKWEKCNGKKHN